MFPPFLQFSVAQAWGNVRVNLHQGIPYLDAILEPSITQVPACFEWDSSVP